MNNSPYLGFVLGGFSQKHGDLSGSFFLVVLVRGVRRHGDFPQSASFSRIVNFTDCHALNNIYVSDFHVGVSLEVVVPDGMLGRAAPGRDENVIVAIGNSHKRCFSYSPGLVAFIGDNDDRQACIAKRRAFSAIGSFVTFHLVCNPTAGAWYVFTHFNFLSVLCANGVACNLIGIVLQDRCVRSWNFALNREFQPVREFDGRQVLSASATMPVLGAYEPFAPLARYLL
jgi:hypothetical protein